MAKVCDCPGLNAAYEKALAAQEAGQLVVEVSTGAVISMARAILRAELVAEMYIKNPSTSTADRAAVKAASHILKALVGFTEER